MSMEENVRTIQLISKHDPTAVFTITAVEASISTTLKNTLENDSQVTSLELDLSKEVLEKLVEYMRKRGGVEPPPIERPLRNRVLSEVCDKIDAEYIEELAGGTTRLTTLYEVILGAMFLDIRCLVHLGAAKIATMIKGQPLDKVKEMLAPQRT